MFKDLYSKLTPKTARKLLAACYTFITIFVFISGQIFGVLGVLIILSLAGNDLQQIINLVDNNTYVKTLVVLFVELFTLGLLYWGFKLAKKPFLSSIGLIKNFKKQHITFTVVSYVMYVLSFIFFAILLDSLIPSLDTQQTQQLGFSPPTGLEYVAVFVSLVVMPAFVEEIVFRGFLFQNIRKLISLRSAALLTSIIFGILHLELTGDGPLNWIAAIDTFILSIFLISLLVQTKSLWASILLHGIKNTVAFVFLFII